MAVIVHRCPSCGHNDLEHITGIPSGKNTCCYAWCPCTTTRQQLAAEQPSEVIPSWNADTGEPITAIRTPGTRMDNGTLVCGCGNCRGLCDQLGGAVA